MRYLFYIPTVLFLIFTQATIAQQKEGKQKKQTPVVSLKIDSAKWRRDNNIVNRDSAYINPYYALQKLRGGNKRFQEAKSIHPRQDPALIKRLSDGQSPFATIVGCSDSRVSGEILFDQGFGDLFVARSLRGNTVSHLHPPASPAWQKHLCTWIKFVMVWISAIMM